MEAVQCRRDLQILHGSMYHVFFVLPIQGCQNPLANFATTKLSEFVLWHQLYDLLHSDHTFQQFLIAAQH